MRTMKSLIGIVLILLLALVGIGFSCLNAEIITLNLFVGAYQLPLPVLLLLVLGLGILLGFGVSVGVLLKQKAENFRLRQNIRVVEKEVKNRRSLPFHDA